MHQEAWARWVQIGDLVWCLPRGQCLSILKGEQNDQRKGPVWRLPDCDETPCEMSMGATLIDFLGVCFGFSPFFFCLSRQGFSV